MPDSAVIIPVFNQARLTAQCLDTILACDHGRVVVVDDASTDATPGLLAGYGDRIQVLTHPTNRGFAASCNDGAALVTTEYFIFLNNDTVPQPGWLCALEEYAVRHPLVAVVGSKLVYPDNTIQHAGVVICQDGYPRHIYTGFAANHPAVNSSRRFQIVTGASMLVRREAFREAGGFDPAFRNGFEDVDLCLRLGQSGHEIHYCAESVAVHLESVSPGRFRSDRENVALYRERWAGRVRPDDIRYYVEDGLMQLEYEGRYPFALQVSPLLATVDDGKRSADTERVLQERNRQVAELTRENTRLRMELGQHFQDSPALQYHQLRLRIREVVQESLPQAATILVVSKGDGTLLDFPERQGWHFPQTDRGAYAGHHPENSAGVIAHLESLRKRGAQYLLIPAPSFWWLDHYAEFREHLDTHYTRLPGVDEVCYIFSLTSRLNDEVFQCELQNAK